MVESGGGGDCLFTSVIASFKQVAFLPANRHLLPLLSISNWGCLALRQTIFETFMESLNDCFRDFLDDAAWQRCPNRDVIRVQETKGVFSQSPTFLIAMPISILRVMVMTRQSISPNKACLSAPSILARLAMNYVMDILCLYNIAMNCKWKTSPTANTGPKHAGTTWWRIHSVTFCKIAWRRLRQPI